MSEDSKKDKSQDEFGSDDSDIQRIESPKASQVQYSQESPRIGNASQRSGSSPTKDSGTKIVKDQENEAQDPGQFESQQSSKNDSSSVSDSASDDEKKQRMKSRKNQVKGAVKAKESLLLPQPNDLTSGLIVAQGHWVFHISMFLMQFFVNPAKDPLMCYEANEDGSFKKYKNDKLDLNGDFKMICNGHLVVAILLASSEVVRAFSISSHFTTLFEMASVFLYQLIIVFAMQTVETSNTLVNNDGCLAYDLGSIMQWLRIEISMFYVMLVVLTLFLLKAYFNQNVSDMSERIKYENQHIMNHIAEKIERFGQDLGKELGVEGVQMILIKEDDPNQIQVVLDIIEKERKIWVDEQKEEEENEVQLRASIMKSFKFKNQLTIKYENKERDDKKELKDLEGEAVMKKIWRLQQKVNLLANKQYLCVIPQKKLLQEFENSISTSDLLKYITCNGDFKVITIVQMIVNGVVLVLESISSKFALKTDQDYEKSCSAIMEGQDISSRISLIFMLLGFHLIQFLIFRWTHSSDFNAETPKIDINCLGCKQLKIKKKKLTPSKLVFLFLPMDVVMVLASLNVFKNNKNCQPYFSNWIICSILLSILSVINIYVEDKLNCQRNMRLGRNIIEKDYLDQEKSFQSLQRRIKREQIKQIAEVIGVKDAEELWNQHKSLDGYRTQLTMNKRNSDESIKNNMLQLNEILSKSQNRFVNGDSLDDIEVSQSENEDMRMLEFQEDIYSFTYLKFMRNQSNNPIQHGKLVLKSILCFLMQILLIGLVYNETKGLDGMNVGSWQINMARVICAFILHLSIMPEIDSSLQALRYAYMNDKNFYNGNILYPTLVMLMKLWGGFFTEWINILVIVQSDNIEDVVKDFIAFGIISEIDNLLAASLRGYDVQKAIESAEIYYPKNQLETKPLEFLKQKWEEFKEENNKKLEFAQLCFFTLTYYIQNMLYVCVYFYFMPFVVVYINWYYGENTQSSDEDTDNNVETMFEKTKEFWDYLSQIAAQRRNATST